MSGLYPYKLDIFSCTIKYQIKSLCHDLDNHYQNNFSRPYQFSLQSSFRPNVNMKFEQNYNPIVIVNLKKQTLCDKKASLKLKNIKKLYNLKRKEL